MELLDSDAPHRNDDRGPEAAPGAHPHWIASLLSEATRLDVTLLENADRSFRRRGERPRRFTCERTRAPSISASPSSSQVYSLAGRFSRADELSATSMSRVRRHRQTEDDRAYVGTTASRRSFTELHKVRGIEQTSCARRRACCWSYLRSTLDRRRASSSPPQTIAHRLPPGRNCISRAMLAASGFRCGRSFDVVARRVKQGSGPFASGVGSASR